MSAALKARAVKVGKAMKQHTADSELSVASLYQDDRVAENYVRQRFSHSWQRLFHSKQVAAVQQMIERDRTARILELAPGPARVAVDLHGVNHGYMVEFSREMIQLATSNLKQRRKDDCWTVIYGNAFQLEEIPELPDTFDLVYTFRFIRHFHEQERARLYSGIRDKLRPGGILLFDVVNKPLYCKLNAGARGTSANALPVYDVSYTENEFRGELKSNGFEVIRMIPVLRHFRLQSWISSKLDDVIAPTSSRIVRLLESIPSRNPLEWIAVCRKL